MEMVDDVKTVVLIFMTLRTHILQRFLPNIQSKRVHLPLGPSKVGNLPLSCCMMPFAAIRS